MEINKSIKTESQTLDLQWDYGYSFCELNYRYVF